MTTSEEKEKEKEKEKEDQQSAYRFKLFSYLSMTIISVAILVGLFIIFQHLNEEESAEKTIANQETLIQNQDLLKELLADAKGHEQREEGYLGNSTETNVKISSSNSERLDMILDYLNLTYSPK